MSGYSTMKEVAIWLQTESEAKVEIQYWPAGESPTRRSPRSHPVDTKREDNFATTVELTGLIWSTEYNYRVLINGREQKIHDSTGAEITPRFQTAPRWKYTRESTPVDFTIAMGSCTYINEEGYDRELGPPYGDEYHIFESISRQSPDLMLWLGDNIYLRENDWTSRSGIRHRYEHTRMAPEMKALLATTQNYAIWDDHDYGPNDAGREFWNKEETLDAFKLFWANPTYGISGKKGTTTFFTWSDVNFYLLDNRWKRSIPFLDTESDSAPSQIYGREQIDWLIESLKYEQSQQRKHSYFSFNVIVGGGQFLSDSGFRDSLMVYEDEYRYLMDRLVDEGIDGVIFLSGDVHFSEVSKHTHYGSLINRKQTFYDITVSPLTSGPNTRDIRNSRRVSTFGENGILAQRNFAILKFAGEGETRRAEIHYYDSNGKLINAVEGSNNQVTEEYIIYARELISTIPE